MFPRNRSFAALGQVQPEAPYILEKLPECKGVPISYLPMVKDLVLEYGCSPGGQAAAAVALAKIPKVGPLVSLLGTPAIVRCACAYQAAVHPPITEEKYDYTPWLIGAGALVVVLLALKK
jgi:hypothetical protein